MKKIVAFMLAAVIMISAASVIAHADGMNFTDVKDGMWFYPYVEFCYGRGYMNGISETEFAPHADLTRAMFVTILAAIEGYDKSAYTGQTGFSDVAENAWFAAPVIWASKNGIVSGRSEGVFAPDGKVTRQEMTLMLYKYAIYRGIDVANEEDLSKNPDAENVASWALEGMKWAISSKVLIGSVGGMIYPASNAERCDIAVVIRSFVTRVLEKLPEPAE